MSKGWFGLKSDLMSALEEFGADRDDKGHFLIYQKPVFSGLGGEEVVVHAECLFSVDGEMRNLSQAMSTSNRGLNIAVIA